MSGYARQQMKASRTILGQLTKKSGVYFITIDDPEEKTQLIKIGMAENMEHRLNAYLLCYPRGFDLLGFIFTHGKEAATRLERSIQGYLYSKGRYIVTGHSHDEEWFELTMNDLENLFLLLDVNKDVKDKSGKLIFPYTHIVAEKFRILANQQIGSERVAAMNTDVKRILDQNVNKYKIMQTQKRVAKTKKGRAMRSGIAPRTLDMEMTDEE